MNMTAAEYLMDEQDQRDEWAKAVDRRSVTLWFELDTPMVVQYIADGFGVIVVEYATWGTGEVVAYSDFERLNLIARIKEAAEMMEPEIL